MAIRYVGDPPSGMPDGPDPVEAMQTIYAETRKQIAALDPVAGGQQIEEGQRLLRRIERTLARRGRSPKV